MCCSKRRQNAAACGSQPAHRGPMFAVLGKMAYDKYQERKQQRLNDANDSTTKRKPAAELNFSDEKADVQPPSYDEVVVNRASVPEEKNVKIDEKERDFDMTALKEVVDETARSFEGEQHRCAMATGMNYSNVPMNGPSCHSGGCGGYGRCQRGCGGHGGCQRGCGGHGGCQRGCGGGYRGGCGMAKGMHCAPVPMNSCQSRCQQKKAERAARKAEKEAAKRGMRMM